MTWKTKMFKVEKKGDRIEINRMVCLGDDNYRITVPG